MYLAVSSDRRHARVDVPPGTSVAAVRGLLEAEGITRGVLDAGIAVAVEKATRTGLVQPGVLVAQGTAPRAGTDMAVRFLAPRPLSRPPDLSDLMRLFGSGSIDAIEAGAGACIGWLVRSGQPLAEYSVTGGRPGEDLFGAAIPPPPPARSLAVGPGAELRETVVVATRMGYAGLHEGRLTVLSPIWVGPGGEAAWLVRVPNFEGSARSLEADLHESLLASGVVRGADVAAIRDAAQGTGGPTHRLAAAIQPETPPPPAPRFTFEHAFRPGLAREDGSTDFRERNMFPAVEAGALLLEVAEPVWGRPGWTVTGEPIPSLPVPKVEVIASQNVRGEVVDGVHRLFAEVEGTATVRADVRVGRPQLRYRWRVAVRPALSINGDVDFATGNIDAGGNVAVRGKITKGFRVTATGDVRIGGEIEDGAHVEAGGSVQVGLGIMGAHTRVEAAGAIEARFVNEATLLAGEDVRVQRYIHDAQVQAGGWVRVAGRGGRGVGGITGGHVVARHGVESRTLGSTYTGRTLIEVGLDSRLDVRIAEVRGAFDEADAELAEVAARLGVATFDEASVRGLISDEPEQRQALLAEIRRARPILHRQVIAKEQREALEGERDALLADARVLVEETTHAGVTVDIREHRYAVKDPIEQARFRFDREAYPPRVVWRDAQQHSEAGKGPRPSAKRRKSLI